MTLPSRRLTRMLAPTTLAVLVAVPMSSAAAATGGNADDLRVADGQHLVVTHPTRLHCLTIAGSGAVVAPAGHSLTLTVDGVETGSALTETGGTETALVPGTYCGDVVLTVTDQNLVPWQGLTFPFRQALYVDSTGADEDTSVSAAVRGGRVTDTTARNITIRSTGEAFNGVYVKDAAYSLVNPTLALRGKGHSDFVGYGAAVTATGPNARLVVDGADITNRGVMRTGVVADGGANVIVKNSAIATHNGVLPAGYQSTVDLAKMQDAPWMLSIKGNARTTNLLGNGTKASYINSQLSSQGWGVMSTDTGQNTVLTSINSSLSTGTAQGYGSYAIGNATERFLGTQFDVTAYAAINRGGSLLYADSTRAAVAELNRSLGLGLTDAELAAIPVRPTVVTSDRFGIMWHGAGSGQIKDRTVFTTKEATFLDKGQQIDVTVDGSRGAQLNPKNGILLQVMDDDDPGPQMVNGVLLNTGVYHEPVGAPTKLDSFDVTTPQPQDARATFTDATLTGDFYNGIRGGYTGPAGPGAGVAGKNLVLSFDDTALTGAISATTTRHQLDTIDSSSYRQLGEVTNTSGPVVNNGVIVSLSNGSRWTVTATSHLSSLTVQPGCAVVGSVTVDNVPTTPVPGQTYTGDIVVSPR
ncbi:MAG: hypothetical protein ACOYBY_18495 [Dermatophilaceae bacterium]